MEIHWEAPEFLYREKSVSWYWITIGVATLLIGIAAWQRNLLFGIFVVVAELLMLTWGHKEPGTVHFRLTAEGLFGNEKKLGAQPELLSFSIEEYESGDWSRLFLSFRKRIKPPLRILIPREKAGDVTESLRQTIEETPYEPTLLDSIEELVGF